MKFRNPMVVCLLTTVLTIAGFTVDGDFAKAQSVSPPSVSPPSVSSPRDSSPQVGSRTNQAQLENNILIFKQQLESVLENRDALEKKLESLQKEQNDYLLRQDSLGVSSESFSEIVKVLQTQRVDLMIDLAGLQARQAVMTEIQDQTSAKNSEALVKPLEEMLALSEENFDRIEQMILQGTVSIAERNEAKMKMLSIQLQIAQAKQTSGDSKLATELINLSLDKAEKQARLEKTERLLAEITHSRETINASQKTETQARRIENQIQLYQERSSDLKRQLELLQQQLQQAKAAVQSGTDR